MTTPVYKNCAQCGEPTYAGDHVEFTQWKANAGGSLWDAQQEQIALHTGECQQAWEVRTHVKDPFRSITPGLLEQLERAVYSQTAKQNIMIMSPAQKQALTKILANKLVAK